MSSDSKPTLVLGKIELQPQQVLLHSLNRDHREQTLLYQQKVAALIECARVYARTEAPETMEELLRVARAFAD